MKGKSPNFEIDYLENNQGPSECLSCGRKKLIIYENGMQCICGWKTLFSDIPKLKTQSTANQTKISRTQKAMSPETYKNTTGESAFGSSDLFCSCPFASRVAEKISERAEIGLQKYGVTCERGDLSILEWLTHLQEELMDAAVYIEKTSYEIWRESEDLKQNGGGAGKTIK